MLSSKEGQALARTRLSRRRGEGDKRSCSPLPPPPRTMTRTQSLSGVGRTLREGMVFRNLLFSIDL